jgi:transmembrane sensor
LADKYKYFSVEEFLADENFQEWVLKPDASHEEYWKEVISKFPETYPRIREARKLLKEFGNPVFSLQEDEIQGVWRTIQSRLEPPAMEIRRSSEKHYYRWVGIAAVFVVALFASLYWVFWNDSHIQFQTDFGETQEILLPDGSEVILNANSSLSYREGLGNANIREVWVTGEAFFKVRHLLDHRPFKVYPSSGVEVEVLGTEFNVYQRKSKTKILLSEGNVTLSFADSPDQSKILMNPGDLVEYEQKKIQKSKVNPEAYVSWTSKILQLDRTSLGEMIRMAEENYGLEVEVDPELNLDQSASGSMPLTDGESFMRQVSRIFNVEIQNQNSKYLIK